MDYNPEPTLRVLEFARRHRWLSWLAGPLERKLTLAGGAGLAFEFVGPERKSALPVLVQRLNRPVARNRTSLERNSFAANALANFGPDGLPPLIAGLANQWPYMQSLCLVHIARTGSNATPALPALVKCLDDKDPEIRSLTARALGTLQLEPALVVPALTNALSSAIKRHLAYMPPEPKVIADALGNFEKEAVAAVPALQQMLGDTNAGVRWSATNALRRIASEALTNAPR
jgi:hypothetical protein